MKLKNIILVTVVLALGVSLYFNYLHFKNGLSDKGSLEKLQANTSGGAAKIVKEYIHDSIAHVVIKEVPVASNAEKQFATGGYVDTVATALKVAMSQIAEITKVNAKLSAENIKLKTEAGVLQYRDKFLAFKYNPDSNTVDLTYDVSLNIAKYSKRKWLIGEREHFIDIYSDDPRVNINNVKRFSIAEKKPKRWGLGLNAGYSYSPWLNRLTPTIGVGINYNLIEF